MAAVFMVINKGTIRFLRAWFKERDSKFSYVRVHWLLYFMVTISLLIVYLKLPVNFNASITCGKFSLANMPE